MHGYIVHRCWVSEFQALPDLDAGANAIALEHIKLENEGWEVDPDDRRSSGDLTCPPVARLIDRRDRRLLRRCR